MFRQSILSADIGGTNSRFVLHGIDVAEKELTHSIICSLPGTLILNKSYHNADYPSFDAALAQFLHDAGVTNAPLTACIAVAGPVKDNRVRFTNREGWAIDGNHLATFFKIKSVKLVNDFVACGYGILTLDHDTECVTLQAGEKGRDPKAPIACIGAGTGLGECYLTPGPNGEYVCFPSEGGHAEFAPRDEVQIGLLKYLKKKFQQQHRISVERVVSGIGLANIYEYLADTFPEMINDEVKAKIEHAGEMKGAVIAQSTEVDELCQMTMDIFIEAYGSEAGVAGLKWLPNGGLYLTGGLTPKNMTFITGLNGRFMKAFKDKGRVSGMLDSVPVYAVLVENLGERGAHYLAYKMLVELEASTLDNKNGMQVVADVHLSADSKNSYIDISEKKAPCENSSPTSTVSLALSALVGIGVGFVAAAALLRSRAMR